MPQQALSYLEKGLAVHVTAVLSGQTITGELAALDAQVDAATRQIEVQAKLPNPDGLLQVGMFVEVRLDQAAPRQVLAVPASSVVYASYGNSAHGCRSGGGQRAGRATVLCNSASGAGTLLKCWMACQLARVVTDGAFKLYPGAAVRLEDAVHQAVNAESGGFLSMVSRKSFTDLYIHRPILAIVVSLVIVIVGLQSYFTLNVRQYPKNENAVITITTAYVGADAKLVRGFITTPIERAIAAADGIDTVESTSAQGLSTIQAKLKLNYDGKTALAEISTKVDQVRGDLPPEAEVPILAIETADARIAAAYLSFRSEILAANEVTDYLTRVVQPRLSAVVGVQRADILGAQDYAMRIWLKPERLAALNISPAEVNRAIAANNYLSAVGQTKGAMITVNLTANTDLSTVRDFEQLVIAERNGGLIRIGDVADVVLGAESYDADVRFAGEPAVFMGIWVLPNANTLGRAGVRAELERIRESLPQGMEATIAYDSTEYIEDAISEVYTTLSETL